MSDKINLETRREGLLCMQGTTGSYTDKCVTMYNLWYCNNRDMEL